MRLIPPRRDPLHDGTLRETGLHPIRQCSPPDRVCCASLIDFRTLLSWRPFRLRIYYHASDPDHPLEAAPSRSIAFGCIAAF